MPLLPDTVRSAATKDFRASNCITIGLVNNMPDGAIESTERQFVDLVRAASSKVIVRLLLFSIPEIPRAETTRQEMAERYRDIVELWDAHLDGMIVTGTEPRMKNLKDEPYWTTLTQVVDWARERRALEEFLARMPFRVPLNAKVSAISAGERQKCEILKQLYLRRRFLILDEPTSVLTPGEADEVLGMLRGMVAAGNLTILMITHKFREVMAFADEVTILRRGKLAGQGHVKDLSPDAMARMMIGAEELTLQPPRSGEFGAPRLEIEKLNALDDGGQPAVRDVSLSIRGGEIVGVAGVSGNGQRQLIEVLAGQRDAEPLRYS